MWAVIRGQGEETESSIRPWKTSSKKSAQKVKPPWVSFRRKAEGYVLAPTSTRGLAPAWTRANLAIMCCGQGQPGFSVPHPFPMVGGRSIRHSDAKFSQLSSHCGEVCLRLKSMVKQKVNHCEDRLSKMDKISTRTASSLWT